MKLRKTVIFISVYALILVFILLSSFLYRVYIHNYNQMIETQITEVLTGSSEDVEVQLDQIVNDYRLKLVITEDKEERYNSTNIAFNSINQSDNNFNSKYISNFSTQPYEVWYVRDQHVTLHMWRDIEIFFTLAWLISLLIFISLLLKLNYHEKALIESKKQILENKKLIELKNHYLAAIVHDLKTPIASNILSASLLEEGTISKEELINNAKFIIRNSEKMKGIANEAIDIIRQDNPQKLSLVESFNPKVYLWEILEDYKPIIKKRNLKFKVLGDVLYSMNYLDYVQIINNLTSNMIKYASNKTDIVFIFHEDYMCFKNEIDPTKADELLIVLENFRLKNMQKGYGLHVIRNVVEKNNFKMDIFINDNILEVVVKFKQ